MATTRWQQVIGILGLVVVLWVGNRLYDVIGSDGPGPGGGTPPGVAPPAPDGEHDPSQFDHG